MMQTMFLSPKASIIGFDFLKNFIRKLFSKKYVVYYFLALFM